MAEAEARLYALFGELGIEYVKYEHPAFCTVEEGEALGVGTLPGLNLKNLLLREKKGGQYYLVIIDDHRQLDFKLFKEFTGWKKPNFASAEELKDTLGLEAGGVTAFGLINDRLHRVIVVLGRCVAEAAEDTLVNFHPLRNTATVGIKKVDFLRFLEHLGCPVIREP